MSTLADAIKTAQSAEEALQLVAPVLALVAPMLTPEIGIAEDAAAALVALLEYIQNSESRPADAIENSVDQLQKAKFGG